MATDKLALSLGLVRRAGKLTVGAPLVLEDLRRGKAKLVILARDVSENGKKKILALAGHRGVPVRESAMTKSDLAHAVGVSRSVAAVCVPAEFLALVTASL
ncbi:MAG: ribosomal L7Ae/L30e/S12e/Gadd45 family protein [Clostridia bacterium]|nr:ribosomal L7Ae/L30e/S12e/Gadd45 family protein [Clostridia bacterium]